MRHPRFIAVLGARDPFGTRRAVEVRAETDVGLTRVFSGPGATVFADRAPLRLSPDGAGNPAGVILGSVRSRTGSMEDLAAGDPAESREITASGGRHLIERYWGDYVAVLSRLEGAFVVRAPFGDLGCLLAEHHGLVVAASDLAMLEGCLALVPVPAWDAIAAHMVTNGLRRAPTCVAGVDELLWGTRLAVSEAGSSIETCWSPWRFAGEARAEGYGQRAEALAGTLWDTAHGCVAAQVRHLDHVAVMLSGGLDSSLLTSLLAQGSTRVTCLNLTVGDAAGDERHYARRVAGTLGLPCHEVAHEIARVDVSASYAKGLARPIARSFAQAARFAKLSLAEQAGAQAVLDGGGGDNLFCALQSAAPVADRLRCEGLGRGALAAASAIARLHAASLPQVLGRALRRAWLGAPAYRWPIETRFLSTDAIARAGVPAHRWLETPARALPGAAAHIALLIAIENMLETADGAVPEWSPLVAQPLAELCLSIPTWLWFEDGHNRALARRALTPHLPHDIAWRRGKGSPDAFLARVFETNRAALRDLLLGGRLAGEGLLDVAATEHALAKEGPVQGHDYLQVLRIADVEAWSRSV